MNWNERVPFPVLLHKSDHTLTHNQTTTKQYLPSAFPKVYLCEPEEGLLVCEWLEVCAWA